MSELTYPFRRDKPLVWLGGEVKTPPFSAEARQEAGILLRLLQRGQRLAFPASRPMPSVGADCHELRLNDRHVPWRIVYCVEADAIVILDVFAKKTARTPGPILARCRTRLRLYRRAAQGEEGSSVT
jgi:phage-related protein